MSEIDRCKGFISGWNACLRRGYLSDDGPEGEDRSQSPLEQCELRLAELQAEKPTAVPITVAAAYKLPEVRALIDMAENVKYATPEDADRAVKVLEPFVAASWEEYDKENKP